MIPQDTNYDSLQVYYDFLEESGYSTEELREFASKVHWQHEFNYGFGVIGNDDGVESVGINNEDVGMIEGSWVGDGMVIDSSVGTNIFHYPTNGVGNSSFG